MSYNNNRLIKVLSPTLEEEVNRGELIQRINQNQLEVYI